MYDYQTCIVWAGFLYFSGLWNKFQMIFRKSAAQGTLGIFLNRIFSQFFRFSMQGQLVPSVTCLWYIGHETRESRSLSGKWRNLPDRNINNIFLLQSELIQVVVNLLPFKGAKPNSKLSEVTICKSVVTVFSVGRVTDSLLEPPSYS